jgi:hypothetical protein
MEMVRSIFFARIVWLVSPIDANFLRGSELRVKVWGAMG